MTSCVVIPTFRRPESLSKTLDSIKENSVLPDSILVIDDDTLETSLIEHYQAQFQNKNVSFVYHKKDHTKHRQGLSESKNLGMEMCQNDIIFYLDDDVVLDVNYFKEIMETWSQNKDDQKLFAVGGKISNNRTQSKIEHVLFKFFGLKGNLAWDVNRVGFQCWDESITKTQHAHYLHGGVSSYRTSLLREFGFATFSGGRTGLEDVELGLRTKNADYHCLYVPSAQLAHYHETSGREDYVTSGIKESQNRKQIFKNLCEQTVKNKIYFTWANTGWIIKKIISGNLRYSWGMIKGLFV